MRVRGHLPLAEDRPLRLPIRWQAWMPKVSGNNGNGSDDDGEDDDHDDADRTDGNIRDGYADDNHLRRGGSPKQQGALPLLKCSFLPIHLRMLSNSRLSSVTLLGSPIGKLH